MSGNLGDTFINGGSDSTVIGNVGDNLKTTSSSIPLDGSVNFFTTLKNSGSDSMLVDGSSTDVEFTSGPTGSEIWYVTDITLSIHDNGSSLAADFGSITNGLTNGLKIEWEVDSTKYEITTLENNSDVVFMLPPGFHGRGSNYVSDSNFYSGHFVMNPHTTLKGTDGDQILVTVQDDLTSLNELRMAIHYWRSI